VDLDVPTPEAMQRLGAAIGRLAQPGDLFLLDGRFGAGKTTFVQGLAQGLGVEAAVTSPSFVLENQYEGRLTLYHVDLYRLEQLSPAFLAELEEHLFGDGVAAVEWPQLLPSDVWDAATVIRFEAAEGGARRVHLGSPDERWQRLTLDESV
jgi:tRNA threonylcarbamoyladenosine biosynthesis protein TsaE